MEIDEGHWKYFFYKGKESDARLRDLYFIKALTIIQRIQSKTTEEITAESEIHNHFTKAPEPLQVSFLSEGVRSLFLTNHQKDPLNQPPVFLLEDGTLNWNCFKAADMIQFLSPNKTNPEIDEKFFLKGYTPSNEKEIAQYEQLKTNLFNASSYLKWASKYVHNYFMSLTKEEFYSKYNEYFKFLQFPQFFMRWFDMQKRDTVHDSLLVFTSACSLFERGLGDLIHAEYQHRLKTKGEKKGVPGKQRELLEIPELSVILSPDVVFLLRAFIGLPTGMNVRNLLWHGFVNLDEFEPAYSSFLLILMLSIAKLSYPLPEMQTYRPAFDFPQFITELHDKAKEKVLHQVFKETNVTEKKALYSLIDNTSFIDQSRKFKWKQALDYFFQGEYLEFLLIVLPQLEHSLRRVFVVISGCEDVLLSAESETVMKTLQMLLDVYHETATREKIPNKMHKELGLPLMYLMHDYLVWEEGLRIRDRISHGIADPLRFPGELADKILCIAVNLCVKYDFFHISNKVSLNSTFSKAIEACNRHIPLFHPKVTLWDEYFSKLKLWKELETMYMSQTPDDRFDSGEKDSLLQVIEKMNTFFVNKYQVEPVFQDAQGNRQVYQQIQLYFAPQDHTVMLLIRHSLDFVEKIITEFFKVFNFLEEQVKSKQATSEQRLAYYELIDNHFEWAVLILQFFLGILFDFMMNSHIDKFDDTFEFFRGFHTCLGIIESSITLRSWYKVKWVFLAFMDHAACSKPQYSIMSRGESKKLKGHAKYYMSQVPEFVGLLDPFQNTEQEDPNKQHKTRREADLEKNLALYYLVIGDKRF